MMFLYFRFSGKYILRSGCCFTAYCAIIGSFWRVGYFQIDFVKLYL